MLFNFKVSDTNVCSKNMTKIIFISDFKKIIVYSYYICISKTVFIGINSFVLLRIAHFVVILYKF